ncbi:histidinol-phosphate transaminase [Marinicrinis lubricantis]|uniref:Histidinol-phosphate aminotransferase n=1 Tax=Marinicrinis lubricantis TaxID=2086470 RepID=A0ABW1IM02_9BACL
MKPKSNIVHLPVYQPGKPIEEVKRELGLSHVIKLASNENPFGCSPRAKEAIVRELDNSSLYPDGASMELRQALADHLNVEPDQLIFGAGSDEIILMLARAYLVPGDETIMATHTFPQYKHNAEIEGAVCIEVPLKDGVHDLEGMLSKVTDKTKIVWICNPNNPTGTIVSHEQVADFMKRVPEHVLVVLDEAYCEYVDDASYPDAFSLLKQYRNLISLRTFSKIYGLASLRVGYGIGHPDVIHTINQVREPFNTSRYGQSAALAAIGDQEFINQCKQQNEQGIRYITEQLERLKCAYYPAYGNFIMINTYRPAQDMFDSLMRKGIIVRSGQSLGFPTSIRVTVGSQEQNEAFINALETALSEIEAMQGV